MSDFTRQAYIVLTGDRDSLGRAPFDMFWREPDGVFRPELSKITGKPVGFNRAQCFRAVPEDYTKHGAIIVATQAEAIRLAWVAS